MQFACKLTKQTIICVRNLFLDNEESIALHLINQLLVEQTSNSHLSHVLRTLVYATNSVLEKINS